LNDPPKQNVFIYNGAYPPDSAFAVAKTTRLWKRGFLPGPSQQLMFITLFCANHKPE
jgi:hypothetical protein